MTSREPVLGNHNVILAYLVVQGDQCPFSHSQHETLYHPLVYKTRMCRDPHNKAFHSNRLACSFAHSDDELRGMDVNNLSQDAAVSLTVLPISQHFQFFPGAVQSGSLNFKIEKS